MSPLNSESFYTNNGNKSILQFLDEGDHRILDVGCGAGSNGRLIKDFYPLTQITGITCSQAEYDEASKHLTHCIYADLEKDDLSFEEQFDVLLFCHILEHLVDPVAIIKKLLPYLKIGGKVVILLPNIANWRERIKLVQGRFEYTDSGVMDKTHLHFYTFMTAQQYLIKPIDKLNLEINTAKGHIPLGLFRHNFLSDKLRIKVDQFFTSLYPNLFGYEILLVAKYKF